MAGKIKHLIDLVVQQRAKGDPLVVIMTRSKLALRGVDPDRFTEESEDNPEILKIIRTIAAELGAKIEPVPKREQPCR